MKGQSGHKPAPKTWGFLTRLAGSVPIPGPHSAHPLRRFEEKGTWSGLIFAETQSRSALKTPAGWGVPWWLVA